MVGRSYGSKKSSLTTVEMSLALEDAFGIEIPDTEQENLRTVQQAIDYVKSAVNK